MMSFKHFSNETGCFSITRTSNYGTTGYAVVGGGGGGGVGAYTRKVFRLKNV